MNQQLIPVMPELDYLKEHVTEITDEYIKYCFINYKEFKCSTEVLEKYFTRYQYEALYDNLILDDMIMDTRITGYVLKFWFK